MHQKTAFTLLLAAALLFHALLGLLAELHEHTGHQGTAAAVPFHAMSAPGDADSAQHPATDGYGILHFGHCCGHGGSAMIDARTPPLELAVFTPKHRPERLALTLPVNSNPYRPPIAV